MAPLVLEAPRCLGVPGTHLTVFSVFLASLPLLGNTPSPEYNMGLCWAGCQVSRCIAVYCGTFMKLFQYTKPHMFGGRLKYLNSGLF